MNNIDKDSRRCELGSTYKTTHISDVITRFGLPDETEEKVLRFLHLKGMIKTKTYEFSNFDNVYREMCQLKEWLSRL